MPKASTSALQIAHDRFVLPNGLVVILHEDRSLPLAVVNIWYRVGSKDEPTGRTGFAHLFEHLMFMGTNRVPGDRFDSLMEAHGGANNASTSPDRTNYYSWGPSNLLPTLLWLEADRMASLGASMTQEKLDLQRAVVRNERRQSYENRPYGRTWLELPGLVYPQGHPYYHPTIGSHEDIQAATVDDVRSFFDTWYVPNNASLVVAGDFDPTEVRARIGDLFGPIPQGAEPPHRTMAPFQLEASPRKTLLDEVPAPRTLLAWPSPARYADGDAEADLLSDILAAGASSRLEQALIHQQRLAQDVSAFQAEGTLGSELMIGATALPGVSLDRLEEVIDAEVARLCAEGPRDEEVERVVNSTEAEFTRALQDLLERADALNGYQTWRGDPEGVAWDLERYQKATADGLGAWARTILGTEHRAVLRTEPGKPPRSATGSAAEEELPVAPDLADGTEDPGPAIGDLPPWGPPSPATRTVGGSPFWHLETRRAPLLAMEWILPVGAEGDPVGQEGLGQLLANLMSEGAGGRDARGLASAIETLGSRILVSAGRHATSVYVASLVRNLEPSLDLAFDILTRPNLKEDDFTRVRDLTLAHLQQRDAHPEQVALVEAHRLLLQRTRGQGHPISGDPDTVKTLTLDAAREAHGRLTAGIAESRFVCAGGLTGDDLGAALETRLHLAGGEPEPARAESLPDPGEGPLETVVIHKAGQPQTVIRFLRRAPRIGAPETAALRLANVVFGGSFTSRLNQNLRERHGFTYGAGSSLRQGPRLGLWAAASTVRADVTGRALEEFLREMTRLQQEPFTKDELEKARSTVRTDRTRAFESVAGIASTFAPYAASGLPASRCAEEVEALSTVDGEDVSRAAATWLTPDPGVLLLVGDADVILPQLESLGLGPRRAD